MAPYLTIALMIACALAPFALARDVARYTAFIGDVNHRRIYMLANQNVWRLAAS